MPKTKRKTQVAVDALDAIERVRQRRRKEIDVGYKKEIDVSYPTRKKIDARYPAADVRYPVADERILSRRQADREPPRPQRAKRSIGR